MAAATRSSATQEPAPKQEPGAEQQEKKGSPKQHSAVATKAEAGAEDSKPTTQPLAPPPKPSEKTAAQTPDYFSGAHNNSHFSLEPNPFEQSFGNPSAETPGKFAGLPSVASLTSPAPLGPGGTPGWQNSLRSGPLSPAMLAGPTNAGGYFDSEFRGSFPTPNESSLRTGLTPGGGGSMFPAPSPNSQAIFNSMQTGGATPGTLDFHRTAMNAAARSKQENPGQGANNMNPSSQPINKQEYQPAQQQHAAPQDPFTVTSQPENDAADSLYMLANNSNRGPNQFAVPGQPAHANAMQSRMGNGAPDAARSSTNSNKASIGGMSSATDNGEYSDGSGDAKSNPRSKGKKNSTSKATPANNGRRKAEEAVSRPGNGKRQKTEESEDMMDDDALDQEMGLGKDKSKMTDEEKRKNFLERNRVAALKCRQRKKQWLANLQTKVEIFTSENDALTAQCAQMRDEIMHLKTILYAHKDCPVAHQQGIGGANMAQLIGNIEQGYPMMNGQPMMGGQAAQGMQRN